MDTQYKIIKISISKSSKLISLYNIPFIFECFYDVTAHPLTQKKHCKSTQPESQPKRFSSFSLLSCFFFFRWASSKLHDSFTMVFTQMVRVRTCQTSQNSHSMQPLSLKAEMKYQHNCIGKVQTLSSHNSGDIYELHQLKKRRYM